MALPLIWTDRIFEKLTLTYGHAFLARWRDLDIDAVKSDWSTELAWFEKHPKAIAHALQNLPSDKPPTVLQFRDLCRSAPAPEVPRLPEPVADKARVDAELAKLRPIVDRQEFSHKDWAWRIINRAKAGYRVRKLYLDWANEAVKS